MAAHRRHSSFGGMGVSDHRSGAPGQAVTTLGKLERYDLGYVFVRVDLTAGLEGDVQPIRCWGMHSPKLRDLLPIYSADIDGVNAEMGFDDEPNGLTDIELRTVVLAEDDPDTPGEAWA